MLEIQIAPEFRALWPDLNLGLLQADVAVAPSGPALLAEIETACEWLQQEFSIETIQTRPAIATTRLCYKACGKDPHRYRNSAESMHRRILQGKGLYRVNNIVDSANLVSLRTGYSLGVFDAACIKPPVVYAVSPPGSHYKGIGREELNIECLPALSDQNGLFGNPTSDSVRTRITANTERALLCIYGFDGAPLQAPLDLASRLLQAYCGGAYIQTAQID